MTYLFRVISAIHATKPIGCLCFNSGTLLYEANGSYHHLESDGYQAWAKCLIVTNQDLNSN